MFAMFAQYPTFLTFLAVFITVVVTMVLMPMWIRFLKSSHIGQQVRADGPQSHLVKQGTPTMGGVIMLIAVIVCTLLVGAPTPETFLLLGATVLAGALGLVDDASKVAHERSLDLLYCGSRNQRLIDMNRTREAGEICLFVPDVW